MAEEHVFTGGCLCGAIRFECPEQPLSAGTCHCRDCQQWMGGAFHTIAGFPISSFHFIKGKPKIFEAPSGIKELGFCIDCGSPVWDRYFEPLSEDGIIGPGTVWIPIGTLDNPAAVKLEFHYCVDSQLPWVKFDDDLPRMYFEDEKKLQVALERAKSKSI